MSRPPSLALPPRTRAGLLKTDRGSFAALDCAPPADIPHVGTVLLVPGFIGSKEDFLPLLQPLSEAGYRAVAVDGRGQHETPGPADEKAYAQHELAADVHAQTTALGEEPGTPVHLLGHSMGALTARRAVLAAAVPCPWASLTLVGSGPAAVQPEQQKRVQLLVEWLPTLGKDVLWQEMQKSPRSEQAAAEIPADVAEFLHRRWLNTVSEQLTTTGRQLLTEPDRIAELAAVPIPKLVLSGSSDYAWPVPWQDSMATHLAADRTIIEGADHSPNVERPTETARALIAFWQGISAGKGTTGTRSRLPVGG
ncbi:alpha/beta fold hydrolase [Streptomyces sp. AC602_WCS936]|uniref:alpha/beta fold hydrolase n=1 Tax=Streptomyces sp. AC602_WCS936 TaxID=2823685 RepID=UPI001C25B246|nr:alpha/beta hydrolase [Streptomyces sp. AC602_WCS936]